MAFDETIKGAERPAPASSGKEKRKSKPINGRVEISTDPEGTLANMVLYPPENGGKAATVQDVLDPLKKHGVIAGIDDFDIRDMVEANVFETTICVARAIPPRNGKNGHFSYRFPQEVKMTPQPSLSSSSSHPSRSALRTASANRVFNVFLLSSLIADVIASISKSA